MNSHDEFEQRKLLFAQPTTDEDVLSAFANHEEWLTFGQIANRIMRSKSPGLRARLNLLVDKGRLRCEREPMPNGHSRLWFRLS